ncbi:AsmA family protein [Radicibacter daui]|uniref:AsmA family protein n=1 Tax=Radicibacter daui TaxID=3064829 RepID=UPI004046C2FF
MRRFLWIVGVIAGLLVVSIGGLAVYITTFDLNRLKPRITEAIEKATGRTAELNGEISFTPSLVPTVSIASVTLSNASWSKQPTMLQIGSLEVTFSLMPLLHKEVQIDSVVLDGGIIRVETNKAGKSNLDFSTGDKQAAKQSLQQAGNESGGFQVSPDIREVSVTDTHIVVDNQVTGRSIDLTIDKLTLGADADDEPLDIDLAGKLGQGSAALDLSAEGSAGPLAALLDDQPASVDLTVKLGNSKTSLKGTLAKPLSMAGLKLSLAASADDFSALAPVIGSVPPDLGAYKLSADLAGDLAKKIDISNLALTLGDNSLKGSGSLEAQTMPARVNLALTTDTLTLDPFLDLGDKGANSGGTDAAKSGTPVGKVFPTSPLDLTALRLVDGNFSLKAGKLIARKLTAEPLDVAATLSGGKLTISKLSTSIYGAAITGNGTVDGHTSPAAVALAGDAKHVDLGRLLKELKVTDKLEGTVDTSFDVKGRGASVHDIMASLNGNGSLLMGKGKLQTSALDEWVGGATTMLSSLLPGSSNGYTVIQCAAAQIPINKGIAELKPAAIDTTNVLIGVTGTIDLGKEQLDLQIDPRPKSTTLTTAVPINVTGPLTKPSFRPDTTATIKRLGGLLGGAAFPPALLLGLGDLGAGSDGQPCMQDSGSSSSSGTDSGSSTSGSSSNPVDAIGGALKGLFGN